MPETVISLKNVNIYQGESLILQDVNFTVERGEFVYLVGKTGTGKSSLLKTLYGELPLREGEGSVVGFNLHDITWKNVPFLRRNLGVVFQDFQLLTDRNVQDNLKFVLKATGWKDERLMEEKIHDTYVQGRIRSFATSLITLARTARIVLSGREMGRLYHAAGVERLVRNSLWKGRTQERFYDAIEWLYGWNVNNCLEQG